jgi:DNA-binding transcriptional LysR family regulator
MELLNDMALFVEVVKARGFRAAADAIGMPNSTLSRRISALEQAIGLRLLHRTTRKIELTEAGRIYYQRCQRIVDEARLAHQQLGEMLAQPSGLLRVSLPADFAVTYLPPLLVEFARRYPGIQFDFDLSPRHVDLVSEPFDLAIRIGAPQDSQLIARPLATLPSFLYAAPAYLARAGTPSTPADLAQHDCLAIGKSGRWTLQHDAERASVAIAGRFTLNSISLIRSLAVREMGIALLPREVVADDLAAGRLQRILSPWQGVAVTVYAITETRLLPAKTQRFIEFLRERMGQG